MNSPSVIFSAVTLVLMTGVTITTIKYRNDNSIEQAVIERIKSPTTETTDLLNVEFIMVENQINDYNKDINKRENPHINYRNSRVYQERFAGSIRNDREATVNLYDIADKNASKIEHEKREKVKEVSDQLRYRISKE
jgi:hypothetical protein